MVGGVGLSRIRPGTSAFRSPVCRFQICQFTRGKTSTASISGSGTGAVFRCPAARFDATARCERRRTAISVVITLAVPEHSEVLGVAPFEQGFPQKPQSGIAAGQSFGILKAAQYPNSRPFDGVVYRLDLTILPPHQPATPEKNNKT